MRLYGPFECSLLNIARVFFPFIHFGNQGGKPGRLAFPVRPLLMAGFCVGWKYCGRKFSNFHFKK